MITLGWCLSTYFEATFHSELIIDERWAQLLMEELVLCPEIKDINGWYKNNKSAITRYLFSGNQYFLKYLTSMKSTFNEQNIAVKIPLHAIVFRALNWRFSIEIMHKKYKKTGMIGNISFSLFRLTLFLLIQYLYGTLKHASKLCSIWTLLKPDKQDWFCTNLLDNKRKAYIYNLKET